MLLAVVFDLDGIIIDSEPLHLRAYQDVLKLRGLDLSAFEYGERYLGLDDPEIFGTFSRDRKLGWTTTDIDELVREKVGLHRRALRTGPKLFPGASDCISRFAAEVPLAIASGALHEEIELVLDLTGLRAYFHALVGSDDTPLSKPAPDPYACAVNLIGAAVGIRSLNPSSVVGIEDSRLGLDSARAAGLRTVGVTNTYPSAELSRADLVVSTLENLQLSTLRDLCT